MATRNSRRGFTLIELLIVVGIISILIVVLFVAILPWLKKSEDKASRTLLQQIGGALSADKVSLSIGVYFDNAGRLPMLPSVRRAETALLSNIGPRPYLPIEGMAAYRSAVQTLLLGAGHEAGQVVATVGVRHGEGAGLQEDAHVGDAAQRVVLGAEVIHFDDNFEHLRADIERNAHVARALRREPRYY